MFHRLNKSSCLAMFPNGYIFILGSTSSPFNQPASHPHPLAIKATLLLLGSISPPVVVVLGQTTLPTFHCVYCSIHLSVVCPTTMSWPINHWCGHDNNVIKTVSDSKWVMEERRSLTRSPRPTFFGFFSFIILSKECEPVFFFLLLLFKYTPNIAN